MPTGESFILTAIKDSPVGIKPGRAYAIAFKARGERNEEAVEDLLWVGSGAAIASLPLMFVSPLKGIKLFVLGAGTAGYGIDELKQGKDDVLTGKSTIDGIMLVDIGDQELKKTLYQNCNFVPDIAGG